MHAGGEAKGGETLEMYKRGSRLDADAFAAYVMARQGATVDASSDPYLITLFRPGQAPERWELKKQGRKGTVFWQRP